MTKAIRHYRGEYGPVPFEEYKIYGPIFHKKEGRNYICLVKNSADRTTITFAKFKMSIHLGRRLGRHEQVDHINNNRLDDRLSNLQVLTHKQNIRKSRRPQKFIECVCTRCEKTFFRRKGNEPNKKFGKKSFCSRSCAARFQFHGPIVQR